MTRVYPSEANFLLVAVADVPGTARRLERAGVIVGRAPLPEGAALRIAIGLRSDNDRLLAALRADAIATPSP